MQYYSSGKILLTGEYLVLNGADTFALPTVFGQYLKVLSIQESSIQWIGINADQSVWFTAKLSLDLSEIFETTDIESAKTLQKLLAFIKRKKPNLFLKPLQFTTRLSFDKDWGLGSSATFIANLAKWSGIDAFELSNISLGGSGYDIAVALVQKPILYHLSNQKPQWKNIDFKPPFIDKLWFVYLNQKQNSREGIKSYQNNKANQAQIEEVSQISRKIAACQDYERFCQLLTKHENILSKILQRPTVKQQLFPDFKGTIKSLGAWGGDFVLVTGDDVVTYFTLKGYDTVIAYNDFIMRA